MIVIDASAMLEVLLRTALAAAIEARVLASDERLHAPHLLDVEVTQGLRRLTLLKEITAYRAQEALDDYNGFIVERSPHQDLLPRVWQLRNAMTAYDGIYVALAEALNVPLLTCDAKLGRSHGHRAKIEIVS